MNGFRHTTAKQDPAGSWIYPELHRSGPHAEPWRPEGASPVKRTVPAASPAKVPEPVADRFDEGVQEGRRQMEEELRKELDEYLLGEEQVFAHLGESLREQVCQFRASWERDAVKLVLTIAERVVKKEIAIDNDFVIRQIQEAIRRVWGVDRLKLRVNPADEEYVKGQRSLLATMSDSVREFIIEPDETIERGGCMIDSDAGNIDARVSTQMKNIESGLLPQVAREEIG
jgi:flagellar biosynthesis/type III secretory pathway protein FliH